MKVTIELNGEREAWLRKRMAGENRWLEAHGRQPNTDFEVFVMVFLLLGFHEEMRKDPAGLTGAVVRARSGRQGLVTACSGTACYVEFPGDREGLPDDVWEDESGFWMWLCDRDRIEVVE